MCIKIITKSSVEQIDTSSHGCKVLIKGKNTNKKAQYVIFDIHKPQILAEALIKTSNVINWGMCIANKHNRNVFEINRFWNKKDILRIAKNV